MTCRKFVVMVLLSSVAMCPSAPAQTFKKLPPQGIQIDPALRSKLRVRVDRLAEQVDAAANASNDVDAWRPDVDVLIRAVRLALDQELFFKKQETDAASKILDEAQRRITAVAAGDRGLRLMGLSGKPTDQLQMLVGGFVSEIDGSVQPFGLVVPAGFDLAAPGQYRLDVWLHGRGDTKTEVPFLSERMTKKGQYTPADTFVLHPFGRHCNAFKFAGEIDVYESMTRAGELFSVDEDRVSIRGFSMGGAGCWHFAVHDPGRWRAANPGAGFVDTIEYRGWDKSGFPYEIDETRRRLMSWYDVLPWVNNLRNTRTIAYSGEVDKQKKAADRVMAASLANGFEWPYVIGKGMGHKIDPGSAATIEKQIAQWTSEAVPKPRREIDFTTYTLRYHRVGWLSLNGLQQHWSPGRVRAVITGDASIEMKTAGVTGLKLDFRESGWPKRPVDATLMIDGQSLTIEDWDEAPGIQCELRRKGQWSVVEQVDAGLRKRPGLQGPIDDAFCDRFVFVLPSRPARHGVVQRWVDSEIRYAQQRWSTLMRGKVNVVMDTDLSEEQIKECHLICFGDYSSNRYLAGLADQLPIRWTADSIQVGSRRFATDEHAAVFCYPNPGNPNRYLVVNSGMTFREFSNVTNSSQIAMLPDWAVMNVDVDDDGTFAGEVVSQGFFDERWQLP